jgi:anaerobic selenocysteine-containing dehydrogenase/NADPH-dependent 2,4-dienoyl-CoA reductase/sulfur reductase-like enzyme/bacterioferritin-associated ferredoxin
VKSVRTTCPYCGVGCGLIANTDDGRLTSVEGDKLHRVNRGATCRKPLHLPDAVHARDRATTPLMRESPDERWRPTTWRRAIASLAKRLQAIADEHGPDAIAFYVSGQLLTEDYYVVNKLVKGWIGTNNVDSNSRLCMSSAVAAYRETFGSDGPPASYADIDQADCILLVGSNTAACHPIVWARIRRRQKEGARLIVVDPRRTQTAAAADLHLPVKPGGDLALLNAMIHVIEREGLVDEQFVALRTEGAEQALAAAAEWTTARASKETGIPAALIAEAARVFGGAGRALALWSMGVNQSTVGTLKNRAIHNLCLLTGNFGRPGTGPLSLTGQPNAMGGRETGGLSNLLPGYRSVAVAEDRAEMRKLWGIPPDLPGISPEPGLAATELTAALEEGRIKAVWVVATNPAVSQPDAERFASALRKAELVVCQDAYHPTETSALAHVALPAAQWPEKDGVMTNSERGVSLVQRALPPPGVALPDWEIFARLGRTLGHRDAFAWPNAAAVFDEYAATTAGRLCDVTGMSHARLRREGVLQWPCPGRAEGREAHPGTTRLYASGRLPTPSGRARMAPTPHAAPADRPDESFPLLLTTGRLPGQWHTMTRTGKSPELLGGDREPFVELHPADAERAGVREGSRVRIVSRRGIATAKARIADTLPEGVAFAPFHWGALHLAAGERALNEVVSAALDPVSKQAELKASAVRIEPLPLHAPALPVNAPRTLVIGGGMAGMAVVEQLLAQGAPGKSLTLVGAEPGLPYDRIKLSHALAGEAAPEELTLRQASWFADRGVDMRSGVAAVALDPDAGRAELSDDRVAEFDRFVVATGSQPALPPIDGLHRRGVHPFRSLRDVASILAAPAGRAPAVVIGGGLLGLEAARGLQARGHRVTVVHLAERLMEQQLDTLGAGLLERRLRELGIDVLLGASTTAVAGNGHAEGIRLADGRELEASLVVVATGIRPDVGLARAAGLEVGRGVVVDDELRTSAPSGWAVGECAEHRGVVYGLWAPLLRHAKTAAAVMSGKPGSFHGAVPATTLKVMGIDLFCAGHVDPADGEEMLLSLDSRKGRYRKLVLAGDRLVGAVLLGDLSEAPALRRLVEDGARVPPELLEGGIRPELPVEGTVCSCASVTRDQIDAAIAANGLERVSDVARLTGACTGCGSCRTHVERILAEHPRESLRDIRTARTGIRG